MGRKAAADGPFTQIWKFFSSVKLTVVLLLTLAVTSIFGTLIPQMGNPAQYVAKYGEFLYRLFSLLNLFDMYHSWWFRLLIMLLTANIVVCSIDRLSSLWKIVFTKKPRFNPKQFHKVPTQVDFKMDASLEKVRDTYASYLAKAFHYSRVEPSGKGVCIYAEKGRWTRLGVYIVHLSVVLLLVGGLIGSLFGFEGFVNIGEGDTVDHIRLRPGKRVQALGFSIRCDDFSVSFYDSGAPKEYRSTLTILEDGKKVLTRDIIVNRPLRYRGINIFQASYGTLPSNSVKLRFTDRASGMVYKARAVIGKPVELPENRGTLVINRYNPSSEFRGHPIGEAFEATLKVRGKPNQEILLPLRFPSFDKMRRGDLVIAVAGFDQRYYTGLQVTRDPGVPVVYAGFIIMIAGCFITFFLCHERVCVELVPTGDKTRVTVMGTSNKNKFGMQRKVAHLGEKLSRLKT